MSSRVFDVCSRNVHARCALRHRSFGGLFRLDRDRYQEPVLVSSADGVGTKLKSRS
jgi:phosphoribosylaminoimidazole (AIR) synthetase